MVKAGGADKPLERQDQEQIGKRAHGLDEAERDSVCGSVPLLLGLASESTADEPDVDSVSARRTSPPPEIEHTAPEPTKETLDKLQEDFARDNPGLTRYRSE